jgi:hypothetical protein
MINTFIKRFLTIQRKEELIEKKNKFLITLWVGYWPRAINRPNRSNKGFTVELTQCAAYGFYNASNGTIAVVELLPKSNAEG